MQVSNSYTEPKIYPRNHDMSKTWRVWFRFFHQQKWHFVSRKFVLNTIPSLKERLKAARAVVSELNQRLLEGWNPITNEYPAKSAEQLELERMQSMSFQDAIQFAFEKKKKDLKPKSIHDYSSAVKFLKEYGHPKPIRDYKRADFKRLLEDVATGRNLTPTGYNKYRTFLLALVVELIQWDIVEYNLVRDIKPKKTPKTFAHKPPTQDQRKIIAGYIKEHHREYYRFLSIIHGCAIRPIEITRIKIKYLHKADQVFILPKEITKNGQERTVVIPNWVMDLLS